MIRSKESIITKLRFLLEHVASPSDCLTFTVWSATSYGSMTTCPKARQVSWSLKVSVVVTYCPSSLVATAILPRFTSSLSSTSSELLKKTNELDELKALKVLGVKAWSAKLRVQMILAFSSSSSLSSSKLVL